MNIDEFKAMLVRGEGGCLLWAGHTVMSNGSEKHRYGRLRYKGKKILAHRLAFEIENGKIPSGMCVCHKCDNPKCFNPDHLFLGTAKENTSDMIKKGRAFIALGSVHPNSKVTEEDVLAIRAERANGATLTAISVAYGITFQHVSNICRGKTWKHV